MTYSKQQREALAAQLHQNLDEANSEINELDEQLHQFTHTGELGEGVDNHPGDDSDRASERERLLTIRGQLAERKAEIEHAVSKLDQPSFGECERCGVTIPFERLEAISFVRYCIECQEIVDQERAAVR